jgi:hypothetical protein
METDFRQRSNRFFLILGSMVMFDQSEIGSPSAPNYQIQSLDANSKVLYTSYTYPLSLTNTGMVFDLMNHFQ